MIRRLERAPVANPPASITRYWYRGGYHYYIYIPPKCCDVIPPKCCDVPGVLYDSGGSVACLPNGGMTDRGDGRCSDFIKTRQASVEIWRDAR
jgi:hypothetical protein